MPAPESWCTCHDDHQEDNQENQEDQDDDDGYEEEGGHHEPDPHCVVHGVCDECEAGSEYFADYIFFL